MAVMKPDPSDESTSGPNKFIFTIRILSTFDEFRRAEIIQRDIWDITDYTEIVPKDVLIIAQKNGGLTLGAFNPANEMVGVLFGFPGRKPDQPWKHCSHMMGVIPSYRTAGIGEALKNFQREIVLGQGLNLITWTVNPLEGVNASLNFGKLGVICRHYYPNAYGEMTDGLNHGLPSDRFEVEWWLDSPRVIQRLTQKSGQIRLADLVHASAKFINRTVLENGIRLPGKINLAIDAPILLLEVPANFQSIKTISLSNALAWIECTRSVFETCFENDYIISEFISESNLAGERRNYFVLQHDLSKILDH